MSKTLRIALDAMGSDYGPEASLKGALKYLQDHADNSVRLFLVGQKNPLIEIWSSLKKSPRYSAEFVDAPEVVEMDDSVGKGLRKRNSSLAVALRLHKEGEVDAVVSAGNTGACMASSVRTLGCLEGVARPAIASPFPTMTDKDVLLLDVGANVDSPPQNLLQFGVMGSIYAAYEYKLSKPTVGLLSIGEERGKGNDATLQAYKLLENSSLNFIGNVEGHDILGGKCDVVITDGFTGNVILKFGESIKTYFFTKMNRQVSSNLFSRFGAYLLSPFLSRLKNTFDSSKYGGAPLLGVNGVMIICHGSSSPRAIKNGIRVAARMVNNSVNSHIRTCLTDRMILEKA